MKSQNAKAVRSKVIEDVARFLETNLNKGSPLDFDTVSLSIKQALVAEPEDLYEFQEKDDHAEIKEAELEGLDDFLLQD